MPRTPVTDPPPLALQAPETWTVQLETITPMFGGSATTRKVDDKHPVRAASVRGHLRFWWRATAGAAYLADKGKQKREVGNPYPESEQLKDLFERESEIWGNTTSAGEVRIEVETVDAGRTCTPVWHERNHKGKQVVKFGNNPGYALFPFQGTIKWGETTSAPDQARQGIQFKVTLHCTQALRTQVEAAFNAWVIFGGIGSRTRRGCGSLALIGNDAGNVIRQDRTNELLTALPAHYYAGNPMNDAVLAWAQAVQIYRDFRQSRHPDRHKKPDMGRSKWPEPDTIRRLTTKQQFEHDPKHPVSGFPRADLGLPIIFHFITKPEYTRPEPEDHTLQGTERNARGEKTGMQRFASPVITKCIRQNGRYVPLVMVLDAPHVWEGIQVEIKGVRAVQPTEIELNQNAWNQIEPLNGMPIREAFIAHVLGSGFTQVAL